MVGLFTQRNPARQAFIQRCPIFGLAQARTGLDLGSSEMQLSQMDATPTRTVPVSLDSLEDRITSAGCNERSLSSYVKLHKPIRDSSMYSKHLFSYSENHHRSHSRVLTDEICYWIEHHQDLRLQSLFNYNGQTDADGWTEGRGGETLLFRRPFVQSQIGSSFPLCLSFLVCIPLTWVLGAKCTQPFYHT